ncbi:hypothetical protein LZ32DRAFT_660430 [Colletotrichum eremochloae]|nr:hypothetical protein LZ32DRAFT_660430 [Colletotrichum eremochloae]
MSLSRGIFAPIGAQRDKTGYAQLPKDDGNESSPESENQSPPRQRLATASQIMFIAVRIVVVLLAAYGLYTLSAPRLIPFITNTRSMSCNCGETIQEARANGCVYDSLAAAWLPPHCRSPGLTAEFESLGPNEPDATGNTWGYWHDKNQTHPMTLSEVSQLPEAARRGQHARFFSTHEWHVVHCVFYWRKMWEAARCARGEPGASCGKDGVLVIEKRYDTLMHINHCMTMFLMRDPLDHIAAEAGVALHSDELHVAKPHKHEDSSGSHGSHEDIIAGAMMSGHKTSDPYDDEKKHG